MQNKNMELIAESYIDEISKGYVNIKGKKIAKINEGDTFHFKFFREDKKVICEMYDEQMSLVSIGEARCHPEDEFILENGMIIAELRCKLNLLEGLIKTFY